MALLSNVFLLEDFIMGCHVQFPTKEIEILKTKTAHNSQGNIQNFGNFKCITIYAPSKLSIHGLFLNLCLNANITMEVYSRL